MFKVDSKKNNAIFNLGVSKTYNKFIDTIAKEKADRTPQLSYWYNNPNFSIGDAIGMVHMLNKHKPKRIVEIGSGYSTALIADFTDDQEITSIDLNPWVSKALLEGRNHNINIIQNDIRNMPEAVEEALFGGDEKIELQENDMLFIDCSHIGDKKNGLNDVDFIYTMVVPYLNEGVIVAIHDMFSEGYPESWRDRNYNEMDYVEDLINGGMLEPIFWQNQVFNEKPNYFDKTPLLKQNPGATLFCKVKTK